MTFEGVAFLASTSILLCSVCTNFHTILQGLEDAIGVSVVHPTWQRTKPGTDDEHTGWAFADPQGPPFKSVTGHGSFPPIDCTLDPNIGAKFVRYGFRGLHCRTPYCSL